MRRFAGLLVALSLPGPAAADVTDEELAKRYFRTGQALYERGDFAEALASFRKAYQLVPRPELQYNVAQACEKLYDSDCALTAYRRYLEGKPDAPDGAFVRTRIEFLEGEARRRAAPVPVPAPVPAPAPVSASGPRWQLPAGWAALGLGALATGAGVAFGFVAAGKARDLEEAEDAGETYEAQADTRASGERAETIQVTGLIVGGVALAAGALLLWWGADAPAGAEATAGGAQVRF